MIYCKDENGNKFACVFPMYNIDYKYYMLTVKEDGVYMYNVNNCAFGEKPIKRFQFSNKVIDIIGYEYEGVYHEYDKKERKTVDSDCWLS